MPTLKLTYPSEKQQMFMEDEHKFLAFGGA